MPESPSVATAALGNEIPRAQPLAWRLLLVPAIAQILLHLLTNGRYGMFRDEFYYLACAARPGWGYVDHPPLSIWILSVWKTLFGDSVQWIRVLPALSGAGVILITGALAAELGGRRWAQLLAGLAVGIGALGLVMCGFYSMNCFDFLFWLAAFLLLVRIVRSGEGRGWWWLGLILGVGLLNKIGLLVFGLSLAIALLVTSHRRHLLDRRLWWAGGLALLFLLPYLLWNQAHDWATLEFIQNAKRYKISDTSPLGFISENILENNPVTLPLWLIGLAWFFLAKRARRFRVVGILFVLNLVIMILQKSKPYYLGPSYPVLMAAGAVAWEGWTEARRWHWARWAMAANLLLGGAIFLPLAVPVFDIDESVAYMQRMGVAPNSGEVGYENPAPQYFSDRFGWEELARTVASVYADLPEPDRSHCSVVARNYGQAGALEYFARSYDLPPVNCPHNSYWLWGAPPDDTIAYIVLNDRRERLEEIFDQVIEASVRVAPEARESRITIWLCRGLLEPMTKIWDQSKAFI